MRILYLCALLLLLVAVGCSYADAVPGKAAVRVPQTKETPLIDGKIDPCWKDAAVISLVANHGPGAGSKVSLRSEVRIMHDATNLYVLFFFEDSNVTFKYVNADDILWDSGDKMDLAEILLQPDPNTPQYYEFVINPAGALLDAEVKWKGGAPTWNILWPRVHPAVAAGRLNKAEHTVNGWCAEIAIPFDILGFAPQKGAALRANFHRADYDLPAKWLSWSPSLKRSIHVPARFGTLLF